MELISRKLKMLHRRKTPVEIKRDNFACRRRETQPARNNQFCKNDCLNSNGDWLVLRLNSLLNDWGCSKPSR